MNISTEALTSLISSSGSNNFGHSLLNLFHENLGIIACLGYQYTENQKKPRKLMSSYKIDFNNHQEIDGSIETWMSLDYDTDPLFKYIQYNSTFIASTHFLDINTLKSNDKNSKIILEKYYDPFEIGEEIAWSYKVGDHFYTINLCRHKSARRLLNHQKLFLTRISNLIVQSTVQHAKLMQLNHPTLIDTSFENQQQVIEHSSSEERQLKIEKISHILCRYGLTHRESEICAYITLGYSAIAIGLILSISINTIATHRKRAYVKLEISSQRELFSLVYSHRTYQT